MPGQRPDPNEGRALAGLWGLVAIVLGAAVLALGIWLHVHYRLINHLCQIAENFGESGGSQCTRADILFPAGYAGIVVGVLVGGWGLVATGAALTGQGGKQPNPSRNSRTRQADNLGLITHPTGDGFGGVFITSVAPRSLAAAAGLKPGTRLNSIDGQPVTDPTDVPELWRKAVATSSPSATVSAIGRLGHDTCTYRIPVFPAASSTRANVSTIGQADEEEDVCPICKKRLVTPVPMDEHIARAHPGAVQSQ